MLSFRPDFAPMRLTPDGYASMADCLGGWWRSRRAAESCRRGSSSVTQAHEKKVLSWLVRHTAPLCGGFNVYRNSYL